MENLLSFSRRAADCSGSLYWCTKAAKWLSLCGGGGPGNRTRLSIFGRATAVLCPCREWSLPDSTRNLYRQLLRIRSSKNYELLVFFLIFWPRHPDPCPSLPSCPPVRPAFVKRVASVKPLERGPVIFLPEPAQNCGENFSQSAYPAVQHIASCRIRIYGFSADFPNGRPGTLPGLAPLTHPLTDSIIGRLDHPPPWLKFRKYENKSAEFLLLAAWKYSRRFLDYAR